MACHLSPIFDSVIPCPTTTESSDSDISVIARGRKPPWQSRHYGHSRAGGNPIKRENRTVVPFSYLRMALVFLKLEIFIFTRCENLVTLFLALKKRDGFFVRPFFPSRPFTSFYRPSVSLLLFSPVLLPFGSPRFPSFILAYFRASALPLILIFLPNCNLPA